jgi:ATP-dependent RNA helicase RhlE
VNFEQFSLDGRLNDAIKDVGYVTPTPIQVQAIPSVLEGRDVMGLAQTGTGKTAAFALPILQRLLKGPLRRTRALIVAPTRELAEQTHQSFREYGKYTKVRSATVYGGVGKGPQIQALRRGTEVIVACPGRLLDLANEGHVDLTKVDVLVLDEADRMCDMGFLPDIRRILKLLPPKRQTLFFSATMPRDARRLANTILNDPVTVQIGMIAPAKTVSHALYPVTNNLRKGLLLTMLDSMATGRVLIFTRTKRRARFLARDLEKKGYNAAALQGNMSQNKRQKAINGFRSGKYDVLVATDVASRGIDVADISHVINFDMPDTVDAYTHRIGRTGRVEKSGEAFTLATPEDAAQVRAIEKLLGKPIEKRRLANFNYGDFTPESQFRSNGGGHNGGSGGRHYNSGRNRRPGGNKNNQKRRYRPQAPN